MSDQDWDNMDAEHVLVSAPLKLTRKHIAALELKFGAEEAHRRIGANAQHALRHVRIAPPYRGNRR